MRLVIWSICWGAAVVAVGHLVLHQPVLYLVVALFLVCVFALVNGISLGISDSNPISSAFVVSIVILAAIGLKDPAVGLMAGTVLLVSTSVACDMQQDRSTGARLGTNRVMQFRYQAAGIFVGALLAVGFARLFMAAYPVLLLDQTAMSEGQQPAQWNAAMTFKFVGILKSLTDDKPYQRTAIWIGVGHRLGSSSSASSGSRASAGRTTRRRAPAAPSTSSSTRPCSRRRMRCRSAASSTSRRRSGSAPAASSRASSTRAPHARRRGAPGDDGELPSDMTSTSLFGGGLIAGDALAALGLGLIALAGSGRRVRPSCRRRRTRAQPGERQTAKNAFTLVHDERRSSDTASRKSDSRLDLTIV